MSKIRAIHWQVRRRLAGRKEPIVVFYGNHTGNSLDLQGSEDETQVTCKVCLRAIRLIKEKQTRAARKHEGGAE